MTTENTDAPLKADCPSAPCSALLDAAIDLLAGWCDAVKNGGTGWDDWDEWYKDACYRPGPLRELIDARMAKIAASVLWEEHKAFGEDVHGTEGVDFLGSDSEGHAMMQALVDETLSSISCQNVKSGGTGQQMEGERS